ncbi:glycosyltransferase family 4 protein [Chromobacterium phragmitis]|uniref:glycosyltransferase family 4 protein n=1 Tax=Chromobacterium amazonense TaxID=1382803 RepID=UPI0021B77B0F|nr:glycosyltransferase family 4 protein [Chromobacterium amazonense]MBM2882788.1 glycosyltransferase family 4 protein [Chromobacterium amazonense]MDE1715547.1 glycosyltransferase family 4 protein [Chromobacterium amazonense]
MRIALVTHHFPPMRTSGAVQLRDLSEELVKQGHDVTVLLASQDISGSFSVEWVNGVRVIRLRCLKYLDVGYVKRTFAELSMPFLMWKNFNKTAFANEVWDGVVWYSPTIFLGPIINFIKKRSRCRSYLIIRDIFPEWAVDMGIMRRGLLYMFFKAVADYQYSVANVIGIQSKSNDVYFTKKRVTAATKVEVLNNWLSETERARCSINIEKTKLSGRKIFVYAGNMGLAQGMGLLFELAQKLKNRSDIGFLFVGRGSDVKSLKQRAIDKCLDNVVFFDEIASDEIPALYEQCAAGLVSLDIRHKTHNIPGKFLSYMQSGLPVLASVNPGNDIIGIIESNEVGFVTSSGSVEDLAILAMELIDSINDGRDYKHKCKKLSNAMFSSTVAANQIISAFSSN